MVSPFISGARASVFRFDLPVTWEWWYVWNDHDRWFLLGVPLAIILLVVGVFWLTSRPGRE